MSHYTDSHAHLTSDELFPNIDAILARAQTASVNTIINICTDLKNLELALPLALKYPWVYNAAAIHPHDAGNIDEAYLALITSHAKSGNLIAIGETGLDYHYHNSDARSQQASLRHHLKLALETSLPVIIHCREAFKDFFSIIDQDYSNKPGVLHCFTGTLEEADEALKRGWHLSFSGIVTFKKSEELRAIAKITPLDRILIETDAPYLSPQSHRGKINEPSFITETAAMIASVKEISTDEVAQCTSENTSRLFKLRGHHV